ncbi:MAG: GAF domain-containing protein [Pusillimonas sp.]
MKQLGAGSKGLYAPAAWLVPTLPLVIALITWCNGLDGTEAWLLNRPNVFAVIKRAQDISIWLYLVFWILFFLAVCYKHQGDPWLVQKIQLILDRYQEGAFNLTECEGGPPKDHNRVTLFRHQRGVFVRHWSGKWCKPWGKHSPISNFLVPVMRSGHMSKKTSIAFFVSDDSDKTEGIAGQAYARGEAVCVTDLPAMDGNTKNRAKTLYAKKTCSDVKMIDNYISKGRPMPRSIVAIPVERNGKIWGVIVLDSRYPKGVTDSAVENYRLTVALIGHLLERAS